MTGRVLSGFLGITLLVLLGLGIPFALNHDRTERVGFTQDLERDAFLLTELAQQDIASGNVAALPKLIGDYADRTGTRVTVVDRAGALLADSRTTDARKVDLSGSADIADALRNRPTTGTYPGDLLTVTRPAMSGQDVRGAVRVTASTATVTARVHKAWLILGLAGAGVLAVAATAALATSRWITRPLRDLELAATDGVLPDHRGGPPELRRVAAAFTATATRFQHLLNTQNAFAAEASEQLRTPLITLRRQMENLGTRLAPGVELGDSIAELDRLDRLVHDLLALAELENSTVELRPVDLDAVVVERAATWSAAAAGEHVTISTRGTAAGLVSALPDAVEQILDHLIANALGVAPPDSRITIAIAPDDDVELHVIDQGPGMTEDEKDHARERFWRRDDGAGGSGLGLALVDRLVQAGGGRLRFLDAPGGGLDVAITFERIPPGPGHTVEDLADLRTAPIRLSVPGLA